MKYLLDVRAKSEADCGSYYHLVTINIRLKVASKKVQLEKWRKLFDSDKLKEKETI